MENFKELISAAKEASNNAYAPYSHFKVGAAVMTKSGKIFKGANVENASYSATVCAERNAIFNAVVNGEKDFSAIAVYNEKTLPVPCGVCLQVMSEFSPEIKVIICTEKENNETSLKNLLPTPFEMV